MIWQPQFLTRFSELICGSTSKSFGVLRFASGAEDAKVLAYRRALLREIDAKPEQSYLVNQVHGNHVWNVQNTDRGNVFLQNNDLPEADALVTNIPGCTLIVRSADCVPILFYCPEKKVTAVAHAGWKGTSKKVTQEVLSVMKSAYGCELQKVFCAIGPSICGQDYDISTVEDDRREQFERFYGRGSGVVLEREGKVSLDLPQANLLQMLEAGVPENRVEVAGICTYEENDWPSYRRSPDEIAYSIWTYIRVNN